MEEVTSTESSEPKVQKKSRKRVKAIHAKIKEQMEFYFSDSNLHKDRFLKKAIEATDDGYIDLDTFLKFNRIKALTDEVKIVADAVAYKSELLEVNGDRTKVRRIKPLPELKNVDERTVYVEHLPNTADHEWLKKVFSVCGKVSYVSLPKYRTTGDLKGFGFVEFETEEAAKMACEELNNPPVEVCSKVGMFPKSSKPLEAIKKKLSEDQIHETEQKVKMEAQIETGNITDIKDLEETPTKETGKTDTSTSEIDSGILVKRVKRRRTKSEGSVDESFSGNDSSPQKRKRLEVSFDIPEDTDKGTSGGRKKSRKRKNRSKTVDVLSSESDKTGLEKSGKEEVQKSDKTGQDEGKPEKRRKVDKDINKEKSENDSENVLEKNKTLDSDKVETEKESDHSSSRKRRLDKSEDSSDADDKNQKKRRKERNHSRESSVSQSDSSEVEKKEESQSGVVEKQKQDQSECVADINGAANGVVGKKKKKRRRRKQHKQKEVPELRVIPKTEWLCLREEYLRLQKASMTMLKKTLAEIKDPTNTDEPKDSAKKMEKKMEFVPDVIVKVSSESPLTRKKLKSELDELGMAVAYIDVKDGLCDGHIRCLDAFSAKQVLSENIEGYSFSLVAGEEEKLYWDKLIADREKKLSSKSRSKKRGHEKWMDKAQKASIQNVERQHITFEDDDD